MKGTAGERRRCYSSRHGSRPRNQRWSRMFLWKLRVCSDAAVSHLLAGPGVHASGDHVDPGFLDVSSSFAQGFCFASSGFCLAEAPSCVLEPSGASGGGRCALGLGFGLSIYLALASHLASASMALCFSWDCLSTSADCSCRVGGS